MCRDRDAEDTEREETWGGVSPHHPSRGLGSVVSSPSGQKWILCIFEVRKKPPGKPFSVFLSDGWAPENVAGPGKTFPLSPLSTGLPTRTLCRLIGLRLGLGTWVRVMVRVSDRCVAFRRFSASDAEFCPTTPKCNLSLMIVLRKTSTITITLHFQTSSKDTLAYVIPVSLSCQAAT